MARKNKRSPIGQFAYWLRYRIGECCLRGFVRIVPRIPHPILLHFTSVAARLTFALMWKYRRRMEENIAMALGQEIPSSKDRKALIRRAWKNFAQSVLETMSVLHVSREKVLSMVEVEGEEHLKKTLAQGKGLIALSAHLGNFTLIGARLAAAGYPFSVVVKQPRDQRVARLIDGYRARVGMQTISAKPRREAVRRIIKALRANGIVLLIADEFKSGGVKVNFMGQVSPAPRGPATLALRTGAGTLPMFVTRSPSGKLTLSIGPRIELVEADDLEESVATNTALFTRHLEAMVRRYPDQWNWFGFSRNGRTPRASMGSSTDAVSEREDGAAP